MAIDKIEVLEVLLRKQFNSRRGVALWGVSFKQTGDQNQSLILAIPLVVSFAAITPSLSLSLSLSHSLPLST